MASTNFPDGITNVEEWRPLGSYLADDPSRVHQWFDDFDSYIAGNWTLTETQAGATQGIVDGDGGILALVNSAADNDLNQIQWSRETFRLNPAKQTWIKARFSVSNATQSDVLIGLYITDTTPVASKPTDGFYFQKLDDSTMLTFQCGKDSSYIQTNVATMSDNTYIEVGAYYDGRGRVTLFSNGVRVASFATTTASFCNDEDLAVSIAIQNGDANARTLFVDYLLVSEER